MMEKWKKCIKLKIGKIWILDEVLVHATFGSLHMTMIVLVLDDNKAHDVYMRRR